MRALLAPYGFSVVDLDEIGLSETAAEDSLEVFATFEENALAKAQFFFDRTQLPTIADDSGLSVDALGGRPGVRSKRWSGRDDLRGQELDDENNRLLLELVTAIDDRSARYVCAAAYVDDECSVVCRGETAGSISEARRGANGFGYDPYFVSDELGITFGEATPEQKGRVSHRARAFRALVARLGLAEEVRIARSDS